VDRRSFVPRGADGALSGARDYPAGVGHGRPSEIIELPEAIATSLPRSQDRRTPGRRSNETHEHPQGRGLAGTVGTSEAGHLAATDAQRHRSTAVRVSFRLVSPCVWITSSFEICI
jgi:hypothetical protein